MKVKFLEYTSRLKKFLRSEKNVPAPAISLPPEYNIPEVLPINCRKSEMTEPRFNLLIPALSLKFSFGGINTALDFFSVLIAGSANARIIITDEVVSDLKGFANSRDWKTVTFADDDVAGFSIVCFGDRYNRTIPVRKNDVFIATAWWTAYNGERILNWQKEQWRADPYPLVYLVQDFESGFYKWSSRYLLSLSTYEQKNMIAVVNTKLLFDFIKNNSITFKHYYIFEPEINKNLATYLDQKSLHLKKKKIIFYGRPSVERNGYEIIAKALEIWSFWFPNATNWEVVSLGETYPDIKLGNNIVVQVKGKVSLTKYAEILLDAAIGISLMVSPHPSYPPLEMAAFDLAVITNKFSNKNLSDYHDNIFSPDNISPENIALLLCDLCSKFENQNTCFLNKGFRNIDFLTKKNAFDFVDNLKQHLPSIK